MRNYTIQSLSTPCADLVWPMLGIPSSIRQTPLLKRQEFYELAHRLYHGMVNAPQRDIDQAVNELLFCGPICFGSAVGVYLIYDEPTVVHVEFDE